MEQKIKQDSIHIGENIRRERLRRELDRRSWSANFSWREWR